MWLSTTNRTTLELKRRFGFTYANQENYQSHHTGIETVLAVYL